GSKQGGSKQGGSAAPKPESSKLAAAKSGPINPAINPATGLADDAADPPTERQPDQSAQPAVAAKQKDK
ncbi:MAG TPA: hypothetical protein VIG41_01570, partial [Micrococcaceae bacterium]